MTKEEIKARIEKKQKDIEKIQKRITKWSTGMNDEAIQLSKKYGSTPFESPIIKEVMNKWKEYKKDHEKDSTVFNQQDSWSKGPNMEELYRAYRDFYDSNKVLEKYQAQLDKAENFDNMEKIPAIWNFLQNWRKEAYEYFVDNVKLFKKLKDEEEQSYEDFKKTEEYKKQYASYGSYKYSIDYRIRSKWEESYYSPIHRVTREIYRYGGNWDDEKLNKILDKDVQNKYNDFVLRITEKSGIIQDASRLRMASNGVINGEVIGDKNKVRVETITAGGYNQDTIVNVKHGQILHYRVLVNIIK